MPHPVKSITQAALGCVLMTLGWLAMVLGANTAWAIYTCAGATILYLVIRDL